MERYGEIARRMIENGVAGDKLVIIASPDEREKVLPIYEVLLGDGASGDRKDLRDRVVFPDTNVGQMMALLSEARVLVCNDSAPLHIAVGFDRPVVALFGPTDPAARRPVPQSRQRPAPPDADRFKSSYRRHMDDPTLISKLTVDEAWEKLIKIAGR
ncbi:MAG: glycosyltransferase family 9 protein [Phycisphaerales bacterium]